MQKIVLTEIALDADQFDKDVQIEKVNGKTIRHFEGNNNVVAIVGCRATANIVLSMNLPSLKLYQLTSAGFDGISVHEFTKKGVWLCNAGDVYSMPIAETVVYGMLQYAKRYWRNPKWHFLRPTRGYKYIQELAGKKLLVMGCGRIGTAVAKRALAFEMEVCGYDRFCDKPEYSEVYTTREELIPQLKKFDYIVTTIPLMEETRGFLNVELFQAMSKTAVIVNVGRKGIFNEMDFYQALKQRVIGGAVLDMFEKVPNPITNRFRRLSNVIVLPGVSAISQEVKVRLRTHVSKNTARALQNEQPMFIVK